MDDVAEIVDNLFLFRGEMGKGDHRVGENFASGEVTPVNEVPADAGV